MDYDEPDFIPKLEPELDAEYAYLNSHYKSLVRTRIIKRLRSLPQNQGKEDFGNIPDSILGNIVALADKNNLLKAAELIYGIKLTNPATAGTMLETIELLTAVLERFPSEIAILHRLYEMMDNEVRCVEIVAEMELMFLKEE